MGAGAELTLKQLLDRVRQAVQGAFANSELPSDQQVAAAGFAPREERRIMPTFFALHDAAFFTPPAISGLEVRGALCADHFGGPRLVLICSPSDS